MTEHKRNKYDLSRENIILLMSAREAGINSFDIGKPIEENPYPRGRAQHWFWHAGWTEAYTRKNYRRDYKIIRGKYAD